MCDVIVLDGEVEIRGSRVCCYVVDGSHGNVFDVCCLVMRRTRGGDSERALAVMSVAESQKDRCASVSMSRPRESASRSLGYEIENCFPVTGALLTRACRCG